MQPLACAGAVGNHSGMPTFPFHIAAERDERFPPIPEMATIEADDPRSALELLAKRRIVGEAGAEFAWLRVVTACHDDGSVRKAWSQQGPLVPASRDN